MPGAAFDAQTKDKNTPLSLACHGDRSDVIELFLSKYNCNVNNQDKDKDTPLLYSSFNGNLKACELLIEKGADPSLKNDVGTTPLWNAVYQGHRPLIELLLKLNVPLDIKSQGIEQHAQTNDVVYIYDRPVSLLYLAVTKLLTNIPTLLVAAGLDLSKEEWLQSGNLPSFILNPNNEDEENMARELRNITHNTLSLKQSARRCIRREAGCGLGSGLKGLELRGELPNILVDYLLLKHL